VVVFTIKTFAAAALSNLSHSMDLSVVSAPVVTHHLTAPCCTV